MGGKCTLPVCLVHELTLVPSIISHVQGVTAFSLAQARLRSCLLRWEGCSACTRCRAAGTRLWPSKPAQSIFTAVRCPCRYECSAARQNCVRKGLYIGGHSAPYRPAGCAQRQFKPATSAAVVPGLQYVPQEFRDWEVRLVDWQTQCSMLATDEGVTYSLKRLMPTVGCEADAQVHVTKMPLCNSCPALYVVLCRLAAAVCHPSHRHRLRRLDLAFLQTASVSV